MTTTFNQNQKKYPLEHSPLFRLSSKKKLASLLGIELSRISFSGVSELETQYRIFKDQKTLRFITEPTKDLALIHKKLLKLFVRINPPDYLHSAIKKRSYVTNAAEHVNSRHLIKIDIKKFYPSVVYSKVYAYFRHSLQCSPDVATILSKICTVTTVKYGTHLPTGSCISPILSFLVNRSMFDKISELSLSEGCVFTLYVDDITVSGDNASKDMLLKISKIIHNSGYSYHKTKVYKPVQNDQFISRAKVTGLIISNGRLSLPNKRFKLIRELYDALMVPVVTIRPNVLSSLVGRLSEGERIHPFLKFTRQRLMLKYKSDWQYIVDKRIEKSKALKYRKAKAAKVKAA